MPPTLAAPIAVTLPPASNPYSFVEVTAFRGDFAPTLGFSNPKGIAYHPALDRLVVSIAPSGFEFGRTQILNLVAADGTQTRFAPNFGMFREVESKIVIVPESGPPVAAGFIPGEIFVGRGPNTEISRLSVNGDVLADVFTKLSPNSSLWGGMAFDTEGTFGGRLVAVETDGKIYLVSADGSAELLTDMHMRLEGVAVAPVTFGPLAKNIIVGCEGYSDDDPNGGEVYAISSDLTITLLANIGFAAEDIQFIPQHGATFFQTQISFDRERENRVFSVSSSQFLNRFGKMIVNNEMTGDLWEVTWDGQRYTQQLAGRVPGRWSTQGFNLQGTELESGCFAIRKPRIPNWNDWAAIPGTFLTDRAPAAATDPSGEVLLLSKGSNDRRVYMNRFREPVDSQSALPDPEEQRSWQGWQRDPFNITTPHALSCSQHNLKMHAFAVKADGSILHKPFSPDETVESVQSWQEVPGGLLTTTSVSSAIVNGRLVVCAVGQDRQVYLNELAPGGRYWSGWQLAPGGGNTDITPTVVGFQDELYLFIKGLTSKRVLMRTRLLDGDWTPYGEVPGAARTDSPITAVVSQGQLFVFIKGANDLAPYVNIASETGSWSGWQQLPNSGSTDVALAAAPSDNRVYLFAKGINNPSIFVRSTF